MKPLWHLRYLKNLLKHKWFVFVAGRKTGVSLWRLLVHDYSKFSRAEWGPYVRRFGMGRAGQMDKAADPEEFLAAFRHHWKRNPHHWEYWVEKGVAKLMPEEYIREMVADWMGAGRAYTGRWEVREWYEKNRGRMNLHPGTRAWVEALLVKHG